MEIGAILLVTALLIGAGFFVAAPFLEARRSPALSASDQELSTLLAERDRLINALQELDFDYTLGKIPADAYPAQRAELLQRGADVLRRIDALNGPQAAAGDSEAEARIEAAVAARRADASSGAPVAPAIDDEIESRVSARRTQRQEHSGGFCPNCGKPVLSSDKFCPHCGKLLK